MAATTQAFLLLLLLVPLCQSFSLNMKASGKSLATTRFVTNKMCPFAQKVWIALEVLGEPYKLEEVSLYGPNGKPSWFWDLNPKGTVPVLETSSKVLCDSDDILQSIASGSIVLEKENHLRLDDPETTRRVQRWRSFMRDLLPLGKQVVLGMGPSTSALQKKLKSLDENVVGPYLCGESVTIADCAAFPFLWRLDQEFGLDECPRLDAWLAHCKRQGAFSKTIERSWWWWW